MKTLPLLAGLISLFLLHPALAGEASEDTRTAGTAAAGFLNAYVKALPSFEGPMGAVTWVEKSPFVTPRFKKRLADLYRKALKEDPEMGYGADAVLGAQDYPDSFEAGQVRVNGNTATVVAIGKAPFKMKVRVALVRQGDQWLVDGSGDLFP